MIKKLAFGSLAALLIGVTFAATASAAPTVVVTPTNTQGWSTADTRPGGEVNFVTDATSPLPDGALQLMTSSSTSAKAQYLHSATSTATTSLSLADVTDLSYATRQVSGPVYADPSYQLVVDLNGAAAGGFTTLVYEPYQNGVVTPGVWQTWDVDAGQFWSSRSFTEGTCAVVAGGGGAPFYTLTQLQAQCPNAEVLAFGVNVGSNNPDYNVYTDAVTFNGTTYNFEVTELVTPPPPTPVATSREACMNGGWRMLADANGNTFRNQGDCVSFVSTQGRNPGRGAPVGTSTPTSTPQGNGNNGNR
jgi:hypothetical protein